MSIYVSINLDNFADKYENPLKNFVWIWNLKKYVTIETENPALEVLFFILYGYLPSKYPS